MQGKERRMMIGLGKAQGKESVKERKIFYNANVFWQKNAWVDKVVMRELVARKCWVVFFL